MPQSIPPLERPRHILHVDDDPLNLRVVEEILTALGHRGAKAGSGADALDHLSRQPFDLVLLDIHMPRMDGIETLQRLRARLGPERRTPVVALTGDVMTRRPHEYRALGFDGFVSKPILVADLRAAIASASLAARPVLRVVTNA